MSDYVQKAIDEYDPRAVFAMYSGGHDSLVMTHHVMQQHAEDVDAVAHINTGIGIPKTREFVRETVDEFGWPFEEYHAHDYTRKDGTPDPQVYERMVMRFGFPGATEWGHRKYKDRLKGRPMRQLCRDYREERGDKFLLLTGVYRDESDRRFQLENPIDEFGSYMVFVNPIFDWSEERVAEYMDEHDLPSNPVKEAIHMSGECLCGAFAHEGELAEIRARYPEVADRIEHIEEKVMNEGGWPWGWEDDIPEWWKRVRNGETYLTPEMAPDEYQEFFEPAPEDSPAKMLCVGCGKEDKDPGDLDKMDVDDLLGDLEFSAPCGGCEGGAS